MPTTRSQPFPSSAKVPIDRALRALRELSGMSAKDVAAAARITPARLSGIENGRIDPRSEELQHILRALGASFTDLDRIQEVYHPQ